MINAKIERSVVSITYSEQEFAPMFNEAGIEFCQMRAPTV
jgi:hypothetical protein